jgi:hypothetical protein
VQPDSWDVSTSTSHPADQVAVDVSAIDGGHVAKVLLVTDREAGEVEQCVARRRPGPVDHAGNLVTVNEHVVDLYANSSRLQPGHGGSGASCSVRTAAPAEAYAAGHAVDRTSGVGD